MPHSQRQCRNSRNSSAPWWGPLTATIARKDLPSEFSTYLSDAPADQRRDVLEIDSGVGPGLALSEHDPCLGGGTLTLNDVSFTTKIAINSGGDAIAPYRWVVLLGTGSPQTLIRLDVLDRMRLAGTASTGCERPCSPPSWFDFRESGPWWTSTSISLSLKFFRNNNPTSSPTVCVVPPSVMRHAVFLGRDSWMRFNTRSCRAFPPRPRNKRVFSELTLSHHATTGVSTYAVHPTARADGFHLLYDGARGVILSDEPQMFEIDLVRSNGSPF